MCYCKCGHGGMNATALSLEQTPPLSVPLRFFLTAPLFVMAAAGVLLWYGPVALSSRWMSPLLAVTHLVTLGFLAMIMVGAVQQLLPILMASPVPRPRLTSTMIHLLLTTGTLLLGAGMLTGRPGLFIVAMVTLGLGLLIFIAVVAYCLVRARSSHATVSAMALAIISLLVTAGIGLVLAGGYGLASLQLPRYLTDLHLIWGMLGWVGLLVIGVAYQVVPMFQLTSNYPAVVMRWLPRLLFAALLLWSAALLLPDSYYWLVLLGGGGLGAGYIGFAMITLLLQQRRRRRVSDVSTDFWRLALVSLLLAMLVWGADGFSLLQQGELLLGILLIMGFAMSVVSGMLYKIVPFLLWLHLNNHLQVAGRWGAKIPNMKQILPQQRSRWQFWSQLAALPMMLAAAQWPELLTRPAAVCLLFAFALLWWNLLDGVRTYLRYVRSA